MRLVVSHINLGQWAAEYIQGKINAFAPTEEKPFKMGLPTGGTAVDMYANLKRIHQEGSLNFQHVITFNMDEYVGIPKTHPESYHSFMHQNLFSGINIQSENVHILNGEAKDLQAECDAYEKAITQAGGIDLFLGGVGQNGHLAFNEPGSSFNSRTRLVDLTENTIQANARFFQNDTTLVPKQALTVGIGTITDAKEVLCLAIGDKKAAAVARVMQPGTDVNCPITALKLHPNATLLVDEEACALLDTKSLARLKTLQEAEPNATHWCLEIEE
jgi:glucosamine-6-phosphate deaminase